MSALSTKPPHFLVHAPAFDGPLDLLLTCMQARRLDVSHVSLAAITREFVEQVRSLEDSATADMADFLVMAAQLVELKARLLLPNTSARYVDESPESAEDLLCRLRAYERFKAAATFLDECLEREMTEYPTLRPFERGSARSLSPPLPTLFTFRGVANRVMAGRRAVVAPVGAIARAWVSLENCVLSLATQLVARPTITFQEAIGDDCSTDRVVGTFLAVLHLWKRGDIVVRQSKSYGAIVLTTIQARRPDHAVAAES